MQHNNFWKKLCDIFLSKLSNPASITLCTNVLSVYICSIEQVIVLTKDKVQNRWNNMPETTKVLGSGEKSRYKKYSFELALLIRCVFCVGGVGGMARAQDIMIMYNYYIPMDIIIMLLI